MADNLMDDNGPKQAAALKYDGSQAPTITASGEGDIAHQIQQLAEEAGILVHHNPQLAKLLSKMELGEQIPPQLYRVIAELIAYAYVLDGKTPERWQAKHVDIEA